MHISTTPAALLPLAGSVLAVDVVLYEEPSCGTEGTRCPNIAAGQCCFGMELFQSCQALPANPITAYARQGGELCGTIVGRSDTCFSVENGIASISGCIWNPPAPPPARRDGFVPVAKKDNCTQVSEHFTTIGDKRYILPLGSEEYSTYRNLKGKEEKRAYAKAHAHNIEDME